MGGNIGDFASGDVILCGGTDPPVDARRGDGALGCVAIDGGRSGEGEAVFRLGGWNGEVGWPPIVDGDAKNCSGVWRPPRDPFGLI